MKKLLLLSFLFLLANGMSAQSFKKETDSAALQYKNLDDKDKIDYLNNIINSTLTEDPHYGDSMATVMLNVAEFSRNRALMCEAYLDLAHQYLNYSNLRNNREVGEQYANKLLELAKTSNLDGYVIMGYLYLSRNSKRLSNNQKALEYNNLALSLAANYGSDSITCICYVSLADTWLHLNNKLSAFQNELIARDFAEKSKSPSLILRTMEDIGSFYAGIEEHEKAKDLFFEMMPIARKNREWEYLMVAQQKLAGVYIDTRQYSLAMQFYEQAMHIADSVGRSGYKINVYIRILNYLLNYESAQKALDYLSKQPEITNFLTATGTQYELNKVQGFYYYQQKKYDSAAYYFQKAEPFMNASNSLENKFEFFMSMASMNQETKMPAKEFLYLNRSLSIADSAADINMQSKVALALDSFYVAKGDYKNAFHYYTQYNVYTDSLRKLSAQKDLLTLEIDNENKRKIRQEEEKEEAIRVKDNIQYMGITAAIASVFILLVVLGAFKISIPLIKGLGFIAFIFLFEFIILLADKTIHHWTEGEPWKILSLKIILIAILYPIHHGLEHKVIQYLLTKDMLKGKSLRLGLFRKKAKEVMPPEI